MNKVFYVTGNYGKYVSVRDSFDGEDIEIDFLNLDFNEPDVNDIEYVSKSKVMEAYEKLGEPCFVIDSGFYINSYPNNPGYPGAFVKRSGISSDVNNLLSVMRNINDRSCYFLDCLTFYDGENLYTFFGKCSGNLSYDVRGSYLEKAWSNLWRVFIPNNCDKSLSEMNDLERKNRDDGRTSAIGNFIEWYKNDYHNINVLKKTL
ncbi:MAG: non-canonical purine NTP pyrophosphatase [Bacilli bacterium]|nr:non-canonical purine NTP pyrophosphatase [Bacilli bacterium]